MKSELHTPVMQAEVIEFLNLAAGKIIVDATIGLGGHARAILQRIIPKGKLIGIDRDEESLALARQNLRDLVDNCIFVHDNFMDIDNILKKINIKKIDGILFDLGVSSFQLDSAERGFSFQNEGPLDMRLDRNSFICAYDLINNLTEEEISTLLWSFGEEKWHNRIARLLVSERRNQPIATTSQLSNIVVRAIPARYRHSRMHAATRTFQAIRIAVNRELEVLELAIDKAVKLLNKNARICIMSFHSLEDRIVKFSFRNLASRGQIKIITPKPLTAKQTEINDNPGSRSVKFRVAERL